MWDTNEHFVFCYIPRVFAEFSYLNFPWTNIKDRFQSSHSWTLVDNDEYNYIYLLWGLILSYILMIIEIV